MKEEELLPVSTFDANSDVETFGLSELFANGINFVALDFETATKNRNSICEIGIAVVKNSKVEEIKSWRVKPPKNEYDYINTLIHGIEPSDTENCKEFKEIWSEILPYFDNNIFIAHNTAFDSYVLCDTLMANDIPFPNIAFMCSLRLSKLAFPTLYSYGLKELCNHFNITFENHHAAGSDAAACAKIFLKILETQEIKSYQELLEKYHFNIGRFSDKYFRAFRSNIKSSGKKQTAHGNIDINSVSLDEDCYFTNKHICFTGESPLGNRQFMNELIDSIGGIAQKSVNGKTNILVVGKRKQEDISEKEMKARTIKEKGGNIEIMTIEDFISYIAF